MSDTLSERHVRVVLAEGHILWRSSVRRMLLDSEFEIVGEALSDMEAVAVTQLTLPDLLLLDINVAGGVAGESLEVLRQAHPRMPIILAVSCAQPCDAACAIASGVAGYLVKNIPRDTLLYILRAVSCGHRVLSL